MAVKEMSGSTPGSVIQVEIPDPRRFSVKAVCKHLRDRGLMKIVRDRLIELESYEMFIGSNYLKEDDPDFVQLKGEIQTATKISGDELEEVLADCIWSADGE